MKMGVKKERAKVGPIDRHIGARMRVRRLELEFTYVQVARPLGMSPQNVVKIERGGHRIMAAQLYGIAHVLGVHVNYFLQGWSDSKGIVEISGDPAITELIRNVRGIENPEHQEGFCRAVRLIAPEAARTSASDANQ